MGVLPELGLQNWALDSQTYSRSIHLNIMNDLASYVYNTAATGKPTPHNTELLITIFSLILP